MTLEEFREWISTLDLPDQVEVMRALSSELEDRDLHFTAELLDSAVDLLERRLYGRKRTSGA